MKWRLFTGIAPVLLVFLFVYTAVVPVAAEDRPLAIEENERSVSSDIEVIQISDDIKNSTPYWILLATGKPEQKNVLKWISDFDVSEGEKEQMSSFIKEIWKKYPVSFEKKNNIIHIGFDLENQDVKLTEEENVTLEKIFLTVARYQSTLYENYSPKWMASPHRDIIYLSVLKWQFSEDLADTAASSSVEPDSWPPVYPPSGWEQFDNFISLVCHSWDHYYNPNPYRLTGWAPLRCAEFADNAKTKIDQYDWYEGMNDLGWSSHFMTDVGNPLHTGMEIEQGLNPEIHFAYEEYVENNWETGHEFRKIVENNWEYHTVYSPDLTTRLLAGFSKNYEGTIYWTIFYNPTTFNTDPNLKAATEECLLSTAQDTLGLVKYVID